jgi:glycosyltransferase involved in cell wall biosynthesis
MMVSIIFPFQNAERFIRAAFKSLIVQDETDIEIIAVNDCSTDLSEEILRSFKDSRLRIVRGPCQGLGPALNAGLNAAQGKFIARMDADDIAMPHRIRTQKQFLEDNIKVDIVGSSAIRVNSEGLQLERYRVPVGPETVRRYAAHSSPVIHPSVMMRREIFDIIGGYWNYKREDYQLWARALAASLVIDNLEEPLLYYRTVDGSSSQRNQYLNFCLTNNVRYLISRSLPLDRFEARVNKCIERGDRESNLFRLAVFGRNKYNLAAKAAHGTLLRVLFNTISAIFSIAHPLVFLDSWHGFCSRMILRRNSQINRDSKKA